MQVSITGRHIEITDALRDHVEKRLGRVKRYFESIIDAHVVLSVERHRHLAEMTIHANGFTMHGEEGTGDMYASIDKVIDKIERQLRRYKTRMRTLRRNTRTTPANPETGYRVDVLNAEDVESSAEAPRVVKSNRFSIKPMSLDEAVMQMDLMHQEFLVFRDSKTDRINVLYRRSDGDYGLIEPEI